MAKITISYRRSDSDTFAGRIRDRIASRYGDDAVYMDIDNIPFGTDFRSHIQGALAESDAVVVVIGPRWLGAGKQNRSRIHDLSDPVRIEVETALNRRIPVLPVLVGDTKMPKPEHLPESLRDFAFLNAAPVDTGRDFHPHMERLLRALDEIVGPNAEASPHDQRSPSGSKTRTLRHVRNAALALVAGAVLIGAAIALGPSLLQFQALAPGKTTDLASVISLPRGLSVSGLNCQERSSAVQRTICDDSGLLAKHGLLDDLYSFLQKRRPGDEKLKLEHVSWRQGLDQCSGETMFGCINNAHDLRIASLKLGPSYPCHIDKKRVEQAICKDTVLSTKDQVMHDLYQMLVDQISVPAYRVLRIEQQTWINERRDVCDEPSINRCINEAYDSRITELDSKLAAMRPPP